MPNSLVRLQDESGAVYSWSVIRVPRVYNCGGNLPNPRIISGWQFSDHDGVVRFAEGNYSELVALLLQTAGNYGFTVLSQLG